MTRHNAADFGFYCLLVTVAIATLIMFAHMYVPHGHDHGSPASAGAHRH